MRIPSAPESPHIKQIESQSASLTVYDQGTTEQIPRWYFQGLASEFPIKWDTLID